MKRYGLTHWKTKKMTNAHIIMGGRGKYCNSYLYEEGEEENTGVVVYSNPSLESLDIYTGSKVNFTKNSEYEFTINDQKMYRMRTNDICVLLNE